MVLWGDQGLWLASALVAAVLLSKESPLNTVGEIQALLMLAAVLHSHHWGQDFTGFPSLTCCFIALWLHRLWGIYLGLRWGWRENGPHGPVISVRQDHTPTRNLSAIFPKCVHILSRLSFQDFSTSTWAS